MGLTVQTAGPMFAAYSVRDVHRLFAEEFPNAEQHAPIGSLLPFPQPGQMQMQMLQMPLGQMSLGDGPVLNRWWFVSEGGSRLLQFQENMFALNWRRIVPPPIEIADAYPGYSAMRSIFAEKLDAYKVYLEGWGASLPEPQLCQLVYDNMVAVPAGGQEEVGLRHILEPWKPSAPTNQVSGFALNYFETIQPDATELYMDFRVSAAMVGMDVLGAMRPYLRLQFIAQRAISDWEGALAFFDRAHDHARQRLVDLISESVRATWNAA